MTVFPRIGPTTFAAAALCSCGGFESDLYRKLDEAQASSIVSKDAVVFNLSDITPFEWDSVLLVSGNESVPVWATEIEPVLKRKTTDLDTDRDRFYFLTGNDELVIKEVESGIGSNQVAYCMKPCPVDSSAFLFWLSKSDCVFHCISNTEEPGTGTVFLFPSCIDKAAWSGFKLVKANRDSL